MAGLAPSKKGWVRKYLSMIKGCESCIRLYKGAYLSQEELIYANLQPTGIIYGYPTKLLFLTEEIEDLSNEDKFKILLIEGLLVVEYLNQGKIDFDNLEDILERFVRFYETAEIEQAKKGWFDFKDLNVFQKIESIINRRVDIKTSFSHKLWTSYLYNSLIYTDIILFNEFSKGMEAELVSRKRLDIMLDVIKVVALAAHADGELQDEEQAIFDVFMASADLGGKHEEIAESFWKGGKTIEDLFFRYNRTWILNRYFVEVAVLTVWSDLIVTETEQEFLDAITAKLEVDEEEKDKSFIAIQAFISQNHNAIPFFKGNNDMELLVNGATERWKKIIGRNKDKIAAELRESKDLVMLINKSRSEDLSKEEKEKVKTQFRDIARTVPSLTLFLLPGGSLILPIVLKVIPDMIPTAFRSNQIQEEEKDEIDEGSNTASE
ncbi:MAG: LETM1-related biofilm-associated protein [Crocinitomicaceae bacterium]|nr:LETM1-related biofilm-associated protein [Crocinitomicaceae bacterium]